MNKIYIPELNSQKNYCILGSAKSGLAAALLLKKYNAEVFVSECKKICPNFLPILEKNNIPFEENGHTFDKLYKNYNTFIVSPGIPFHSKLVQDAYYANIEVLSEISLALKFIQPHIKLVGITGTNGKSTTTHFCNHLLNAGGLKSFACGNIGLPLSEVVLQQSDYKALCIELSSYQLEYHLPKVFDATIFLNLQNDHLERHLTPENYLKAKWNLILSTKDDGICIIDEYVLKQAKALCLPMPKCSMIINKAFISSSKTETEKGTNLCLMGEHNKLNIGAASKVAEFLGISIKTILQECDSLTSSYIPLSHRLETVISDLSQIFINDSKATNVESTLVALKSIQKPIHLLLGGKPKGDSYAIIANINAPIVKIYPFGEAAKKIKSDLKDSGLFIEPDSHDMISASKNALKHCKSGEVILLSPACSSFDEFDNFEHRGNVFKAWVQSLKEHMDESK